VARWKTCSPHRCGGEVAHRQNRSLHRGRLRAVTLILLAAKFLFDVPDVGSLPLLVVMTFLFIVANLAVGIHVFDHRQEPASGDADGILLFPAVAAAVRLHVSVSRMPVWAQNIGECLPLTHFCVSWRGILLKGNGMAEIAPDLWPMRCSCW